MGCCSTFGAWMGCSCRPARKGEKGSEPVGINKRRACTDVPCCLVFLAVWGVVGYFYYAAVAGPIPGDPMRLVRPTNMAGELCPSGESGFYPNLRLVASVPTFDAQIVDCTADCNAVTCGALAFEDENGNTLCAGDCTGDDCKVFSHYPSTRNSFTNMCYPDVAAVADMLDTKDVMGQMIGDMNSSLAIIGASVGVSILVAFIYSWIMKRCAGVVVWMAIIGIEVGLGALAFTFLSKGCVAPLDSMCTQEMKDEAAARNQTLQSQIVGYTAAGMFVIFGLIICCLRKRIKIAVEVVKSASRAIGDMPLMIFFPIIPMIIATGFTIGWIFMSMFIYSMAEKLPVELGDIALPSAYSDVTEYTTYVPDENMQKVLIGHLFFLLWVNQFIVYFVYLAQSGAVADWYFTRRDDKGKKVRGDGDLELQRSPICRAMGRVFRYHMGTVAIASFLVALIQFIRICFEYVARKMDKKKNPLAKVLICVIRCALWCLEKIMDAISKNSLVFTAIYGDAFCPACYGSFKLIWRNLARVAAISMVSHYIIFLGKLVVAAASTGLCVLVLTMVEPYKNTVTDPLLPAILTFILSYFVGAFFMTTYATSIDTVFICFLVDEESNGDKMLADKGLKNIVEKHADDSKAIAAKYHEGSGHNNATVPTTTEE